MGHSELIKPNSTFSFTITQSDAGTRLDQFMCRQFPLYSRNFFQQTIDKKRIWVNDTAAIKCGVKLRFADIVTITFPPDKKVDASSQAVQELGIELLHEDPHFLIIYKPAGVLVHRPNTYCTTISLVDWITNHYQEIKDVGFVDRPGIIHRLDKNTSGLLVIPRTNIAHNQFGAMFKDRTIHKTYYALVQGHPDREGSIDFPIGRDPRIRTRMKAYDPKKRFMPEDVRQSLTHYKVVEYFKDSSLVEVTLVTGRTHQIRVHFTAIGHPLIGDTIYGDAAKEIDRQALHAHSVSFTFNEKNYTFSRAIPDDMATLITGLRQSSQN